MDPQAVRLGIRLVQRRPSRQEPVTLEFRRLRLDPVGVDRAAEVSAAVVGAAAGAEAGEGLAAGAVVEAVVARPIAMPNSGIGSTAGGEINSREALITRSATRS